MYECIQYCLDKPKPCDVLHAFYVICIPLHGTFKMQNTVTLTKFEHALIVALALKTPKLMRKGDWVSVQLTDEQRELIAGVLREFMSGLTQKILGSAPAGAASNLDFSRIPR